MVRRTVSKQTYGNWVNPVLPLPEPSNDPLNPESRNNHAYLNFVTGEWNHTWGPFPAGPRGNPFIGDANQDFERDRLESELPYIIEKSSRWDLGMTSDVSLKGIRKVLVIPARFLDKQNIIIQQKHLLGLIICKLINLVIRSMPEPISNPISPSLLKS